MWHKRKLNYQINFQIPRNVKGIQYFISCVSHAVINGLYFEQLWCSYIICVKQSKKS